MTKDDFILKIQKEIEHFNECLATSNGDWIVKGFIDVYESIYTITLDTKVISKVIEILLIPTFERFARENNLSLELASQQNYYPDLTFICNETGRKYAVDIKTTMKDDNGKVKSMTLGAFTGYFRNRESVKNINYPYSDYSGHFVFGVIYSQVVNSVNEKQKYHIDELADIKSVIENFQFFVQPKYKIASGKPGSGNTKNIGAVANLNDLINGNGPFVNLGEEIFDDYWTNYLTKDMAREIGLNAAPYNSIESYIEYKRKQVEIVKKFK